MIDEWEINPEHWSVNYKIQQQRTCVTCICTFTVISLCTAELWALKDLLLLCKQLNPEVVGDWTWCKSYNWFDY